LLVQDLRDNLHEALSILEDIDCTQEFVTDPGMFIDDEEWEKEMGR